MIGDGLRFDWKSGPPITPHRKGNPPSDEVAKGILDNKFSLMLQKGAIRPVDHSDDGVLTFFLQDRKRPLANGIRKISFKMTTPKMIRSWI